MRIRVLFTMLLLVLLEAPRALGHGWSEQMSQELNAPTPEWLSIGAAIQVAPSDDAQDDQYAFRSVSGDSESTRDRVKILGKNIEIKVDYEIRWYRGSSLSPDGTKLIINSGMKSRVYEILPNGTHRAVELRLPHVTYDAGPKGFITCWSWADDKTLIGEAEIDTELGEFIERRIYVFHLNESILSRLDVNALKLKTTEGLTVSKVGLHMDRLKLSVGNSEFTVAADLKSQPKIDNQETVAPKETAPLIALEQQLSETSEPKAPEPKAPEPKAPEPKAPEPRAPEPNTTTANDESAATPWFVAGVLILAVIGLLWLLVKRLK